MPKEKKKSNKLSIYLIKEEFNKDEILNSQYELLDSTDSSETYYCPSVINTPKWLKDYYRIESKANISTSNSKVVTIHTLNIDGKNVNLAVVFGHGKDMLNTETIEEQFGIKVLLNSVKEDDFRKLVTSSYASDHKIKNEQMAKKTDIKYFGFDINTDLVRKATAKSDDELFNGNTITGADLFSVSVPYDYNNVEDFLIKIYKRYKEDKYKENFGWLDNIKEVREKNKKSDLDALLIEKINEKEFDKVWAAIPENVEWERIQDFRYKRKTPTNKDDIEIEDIIKLYPEERVQTIEQLKDRQVYAIETETEEELFHWSIYNCLIAEIQHDGKAYCLSFGKWYQVKDTFVEEIDEYYEQIELDNEVYPNNKDNKEEDYNKELSTCMPDSIVMDQKLVKLDGMGKSSVEVCDVLTATKKLIHVKKNGGSSYLSHLFNQATVSGEMLLEDSFRKEANKKAEKEIFDSNFKSNDYTIVLAIITNKNLERPKIPFFSKVSIRYAKKTLEKWGYKVKLKNIYNEEGIKNEGI